MAKATVKIVKGAENITKAHKYDIIDDYIYTNLSNKELAEKYQTSENNIGLIVSRHWKCLCNVRETKMLIHSQFSNGSEVFLKTDVLDTEKINKEFLALLSEPDSVSLTDNELVFCELYNDDGDEIRSLEESKLNVGLKKTRDERDKEEYKHALTLRSFYLRRKPNVANYLNQIKKEKIKKIVDGKEFIQVELLSVIERLKAHGSPQSLATYLKAIESLGRTWGSFDDKITINDLSGDTGIERILAKAKEAQEKLESQKPN
jgi:predicted DNA-binding protein YlxM (UPF0122 family)